MDSSVQGFRRFETPKYNDSLARPHATPRQLSCLLATAKYLHAIYPYVRNSLGILMRVFERSAIRDGTGIEGDEFGAGAGSDDSAIGQAKAARRERPRSSTSRCTIRA